MKLKKKSLVYLFSLNCFWCSSLLAKDLAISINSGIDFINEQEKAETISVNLQNKIIYSFCKAVIPFVCKLQSDIRCIKLIA